MQTTPLRRMLLVLVASLVGLALDLSLAVAQSTVPRLGLSLNATSFRPGETLVLSATVTPGSTPVQVDAYVAVELPDGSLLFFQGNDRFTPVLQPIVAGVTPAPVTGEIFRYPFTGAEPVGPYRWLAAFTAAGTLQLLGDIVVVPFTFVAGNTPPVARAGDDHFLRLGNSVTLDGSGSTDADGDGLTYRWAFTTVPTGSRITAAALVPASTAVSPTFTPDVVGQYQLTLTVHDGHGGPGSADIVGVNAQVPDNQSAGPCSCEGPPGTPVALPVLVTDAQGQGVPNWPVTFTLVQGDSHFETTGLSVPVAGPTEALPTVTVPTNDMGVATATLVLGTVPVHIVTAQGQDVPQEPVLFRLQVTRILVGSAPVNG